MSESKDISTLEIPEHIKEIYRKEMGIGTQFPEMNFWGAFVTHLIKLVKLHKIRTEILKEKIEKLEQELEIRTGEYKHNKVTEGVEALQDAGFSVELLFRERKNV
jgi:hypothetical protein